MHYFPPYYIKVEVDIVSLGFEGKHCGNPLKREEGPKGHSHVLDADMNIIVAEGDSNVKKHVHPYTGYWPYN